MMLVRHPNPTNMRSQPPILTAQEIIVFFWCSLANIAYNNKTRDFQYTLQWKSLSVFAEKEENTSRAYNENNITIIAFHEEQDYLNSLQW